MTELIVKENLVPADVFKLGGTDAIISAIEAEVNKHKPDLTTDKGRKAIASLARKVASSKTLLEKMGKQLKSDYKAVIDPIDAERKKMRESLDKLRDKARKPLTDWEAEKEKKEAEERAAFKFQVDWDNAIIDNDLFNRERELARKEAEQDRIEEEKRQKEESERLEKERLEREERLKKEAAKQAVKDAEEKARKEKEEDERNIREANKREEQLKFEAEKAEIQRLADIEEAKQRAEREKQEALAQQRREHEEKELAEQARLAEEKRIEDARKADEDHRRTVNNLILSHFVDAGLTEDAGKKLIGIIVTGGVPNLVINY